MRRIQGTFWTLTTAWLLIWVTGCQEVDPADRTDIAQDSNVNVAANVNENSLVADDSLNTGLKHPEQVELQNASNFEIKKEAASGTKEGEANFDEATLSLGATAYQQGMCAKCHDERGAGTPRGPDLTDTVWEHGDGSLESIRNVLITGGVSPSQNYVTRIDGTR